MSRIELKKQYEWKIDITTMLQVMVRTQGSATIRTAVGTKNFTDVDDVFRDPNDNSLMIVKFNKEDGP